MHPCTLAPWVQTWFKPESKRPVFRPCWPDVAVLRVRWGRNRSPPGERPCRATQGRFFANRYGGAVQVSFFSAQSCKLKGKPSSLRRPTKNLPLGGGQAERSSDVVGRHIKRTAARTHFSTRPLYDWRNRMSNKKDRAFTVRFTEEQFQHIREQ